MTFDPLVFINCRDRVTPLRRLVAWLERAGHQRIVLLDNASTYGPLLEFLAGTPHEVRRFATNHGSRALWRVLEPPAEWFVYTDPDIIPTEACPQDAAQKLLDLLEGFPDIPKAGLGLYLDDVAVTMPSYAWETGPLIRGPAITNLAYQSLIDTTFALYRPRSAFMHQAARMRAPYEARHDSWYKTEPDAEDAYYLARALPGPEGSSWAEQKGAAC